MIPPIIHDYSLDALNTFGIAARARQFAAFGDEAELRALLGEARLPVVILGGGSNILLTGDVEALVLHNQIMGVERVDEDERGVVLRVGAGENWHSLVEWALRHDYGGLENLSLIPGSVGAAPIQNIGAYGVELKSCCLGVSVVDLKSGEIRQIAADDCRFGYRNSIFKRAWKGRYCVSRVLLRLSKAPHMLQLSYGAIGLTLAEMGVATPTIRDVSVAVCMIRRAKLPDPKALGNAGSFFKNPVVTEAQLRRILGAYPRLVYFPTEKGRYKLAAGWLIENLGWKGYRRGDAGCYEKQALVLVNHGRAAGEDIHKLALRIAASVEEVYGVRLEPEVNIWGV